MATDQNADNGALVPVWKVERVEDTTAYAAGKGAVRVRRIYYRLFDGTESYVELPADGYTPEKANAAIEAHAFDLAQTVMLQASSMVPKGG